MILTNLAKLENVAIVLGPIQPSIILKKLLGFYSTKPKILNKFRILSRQIWGSKVTD